MKFIDDIIHGKSEDIFIRSARNREFKEKYGNIHIATWLPFYFTYINVKDVIKKNPEITKKERIDKQYYTTFAINKSQVLESIKIAERFINELDLFIDKITNREKIKFKDILIKTYF